MAYGKKKSKKRNYKEKKGKKGKMRKYDFLPVKSWAFFITKIPPIFFKDKLHKYL